MITPTIGIFDMCNIDWSVLDNVIAENNARHSKEFMRELAIKRSYRIAREITQYYCEELNLAISESRPIRKMDITDLLS